MNKSNIPKTIIRVIGFGNIFMSDDGVGIKVLETLPSLPGNVEVIDGGTSAADLINYAKQCGKIVIIDAVDAGQKPGEIIRFGLKEIDQFYKNIRSYSLHDFGLGQALELIRRLHLKTEIIIIGIKPLNVSFGQELSERVKSKITEMAEMVLAEINV